MISISLKVEKNTPQYSLNKCYSCESLEGKSYCKIKNRGCCFYYPKFSLLDLQKMSITSNGMNTLNKILDNSGTKIYKYYIHCTGYFDDKKYNNYLNNNLFNDEEDKFPDKTIFFRACPFVTANEGCSIPPQHRTTVCNFFICKSIYEKASKIPEFHMYIKERNSYVRWCEWENEGLIHLLNHHHINLIDDFNECIELLKLQPINNYEFPELPSINFDTVEPTQKALG